MPPRTRPSAPTLSEISSYRSRQNFLDNAFGYQAQRDASRNQRIRYFLSQGLAVVTAASGSYSAPRGRSRSPPVGRHGTGDIGGQSTAGAVSTTPLRPVGPPGMAPDISPAKTLMDVVMTEPGPVTNIFRGRRNGQYKPGYFGPLRAFNSTRAFRRLGAFSRTKKLRPTRR